ncbi:hypothetical protein LOL03_001594 [Acinetobacter baumannii]
MTEGVKVFTPLDIELAQKTTDIMEVTPKHWLMQILRVIPV